MELVRKEKSTSSCGQAAKPKPRVGERGHHRLLAGRRRSDAPTVDANILRGAGEAKRQREGDRPGQPVPGIAKGNAGERNHDAELGNDDPGTAAAKTHS